jgi:hypothetical protein
MNSVACTPKKMNIILMDTETTNRLVSAKNKCLGRLPDIPVEIGSQGRMMKSCFLDVLIEYFWRF